MIVALQDAKRHTADVVAERMSLEQQMAAAQKGVDQSDADAHLALSKGREDLARQALTVKATATAKLQSLQAAHDAIQAQEAKLSDYCATMQQRIESFRTQKEVVNYLAINDGAFLRSRDGRLTREPGNVVRRWQM